VRTAICELLDIEVPLLAFSHCRDVVAAVTRAGGFGVLGASSHTPERLDKELSWIDEQVGGRPYGVDVIIAGSLAGAAPPDPAELRALIPAEHREFVDALLRAHGVDPVPAAAPVGAAIGDPDTGARLLDVTFRHPVRFVANALGVPPPFMIERARAEGVPVGALVGTAAQAVRQVRAGVDIVIAQGTEAGGHCGEISTMVLVPEVIEAIRPVREVPVLAAGGIVTGRQLAAAIALGAAGGWTGSVWLTTHEAETAPYTRGLLLAASSADTVRSRGRTGKPSRQLRSEWTAAWDGGQAPAPLPMPLQSILSEPALRRIDELAARGDIGARALATYWVGQGVGLMNRAGPAAEVVRAMIEDYLDAVQRLYATVQL
jgi:NAD(P)H-dependent flavin oxidoreductase YrpB (nitropropane dioxygenase family)